MAITQAICNSFKTQCINGEHLASHVYKMALYTSAAALDKNTTSYTGLASEVANGNGYTTGGKTLAGRTVTLVGDTAVLDFTDPVWLASSIGAAAAVIYNDSHASKATVTVLSFGGTITSTNDSFTVELPAPTATEGVVRLA